MSRWYNSTPVCWWTLAAVYGFNFNSILSTSQFADDVAWTTWATDYCWIAWKWKNLQCRYPGHGHGILMPVVLGTKACRVMNQTQNIDWIHSSVDGAHTQAYTLCIMQKCRDLQNQNSRTRHFSKIKLQKVLAQESLVGHIVAEDH